jgi:hypothetical protein
MATRLHSAFIDEQGDTVIPNIYSQQQLATIHRRDLLDAAERGRVAARAQRDSAHRHTLAAILEQLATRTTDRTAAAA